MAVKVIRKALVLSGEAGLLANLTLIQQALVPELVFSTATTLKEALAKQDNAPDDLIIIDANKDRDEADIQREFRTLQKRRPDIEVRLVNFGNMVTREDVEGFFDNLSLSSKIAMHQFRIKCA